MADSIRVNNNTYSWGSIIFKLGDDRWYGFTSIAYGDKRERVKAYGMGRHHAPRGRSAGKYSVDPVKVTGWKDSVQALRDALAAKSADGTSYGNVEFQGLIQYIEPDGREFTVELDRLVWSANTAGDEEAPDSLKEDFELDCMLIRRNGLTLFDGTEGQP
jgi:hypothetical protein